MSAAQAEARRYVIDILAGLVPSDPLFDPIYDAVTKHGGTEFERRKASIDVVAMAAEIRMIRAKAEGGAS